MGNSHCVPQAPRRFRASFSRKPSLKGNREDSARKLAGLFGTEAARDRDTAAADKLFRYIPGTDIPGLESQPEPLEQPFLSVFKKGRQRVPVRNLGKVVHYAKVQLRFPHSQDVSDCYLELFPSHLYFQAHSPEGLTFQGLLPLTELSVCPVEGSQEHAFQITGVPWGASLWAMGLQALPSPALSALLPAGPLPAPLLLLCPSEAERDRWLYHLEKQVALVRGLQRCHSAPPQVSAGDPDELPWTLQHHLSRLRTASGRELVGSAVCASRVRLQHLPSQEQWERLLVLYPASLAIFSEETDGLCFKGELPLSAVGIQLEEEEKQAHSFLIEGPLINTIRVLCASYEDYSHWLCCLRTMSRRDPRPPSSAEGVPGRQVPPQVSRGSLSADGQASWGSGCPVPPSTRTSHSLPGSSVPAQPDQASPVCTSISCRRAELRRSGSSRSPRSKAGAEGPGTAAPRHLRLDLTELSRLSLEGGPEAPDHTLETPHSPLYADPYTPPATSHRKITDVRGLDEFLSALRSCPGPAPSSPFPSVPVSVPVSDPGSGPSSSPGPPGPHLLSRKGALQSRAAQRHRGSVKGGGPQRPDSPQLVSSTPGLRADDRSPRRREGPGYDNSWNKMSSPSQQTWARLGEPGAEGVVVQWI
uniref:Pleckstrin homology domain containing N1 n=1 Tax=Propithecus coquereli TaxID=379532 RepID=A0A2K6G119_PROCO